MMKTRDSIRLAVDGEVFCLQKGGGISRIFEEILPRLKRVDTQIFPTLFLRETPRNQGCLDLGVPVRCAWMPAAVGRGYRLRKIVRSIIEKWISPIVKRRLRYDVFLSTYFALPPRVGAPSIVFVYDMVYERFPGLFETDHHALVIAQKRMAIEQASLVLCISKATRDDVVELIGVPQEKCRVVYLSGGRFAGFEQRVPCENPDAKIELLYVGAYRTPYKNFRFLLHALCHASDLRVRTATLRVVTRDQPSATEIARFRELWPMGVLAFETGCGDQELAHFYRTCTALVYPSLYEGFGLPLIEAHSLGTPVVCSDIPVFREINDGLFYLFDPNSGASLEQAVIAAHEGAFDEKLIHDRREHAARFSWDRAAEKVAQAVHDAAEMS